ncbi:MAG: hypothetical protein FIA91_06735, partial [Geobacter sp.]|nr:hypothetical protein [Geobacter sp.]
STGYEYDNSGRLSKTTGPLYTTSYQYDANGNTTAVTDSKRATITYLYNAAARLTKKTYPDNSSISYAYDTGGRLTSVSGNGSTIGYQYDAANRLVQATDSRGYTLAYEYDNAGNRTKTVLNPGSPDQRITSYSYGTGNRLTAITSAAGAFTYSYDARGRRSAISYPNGIAATFSSDQAGRLSGLTHGSEAGTIASYSYSHDNIGNRLSKNSETYLYDTLYRVLTVASATPETYSYDAVGNRQIGPGYKDSGYQHDEGNRMIQGRKLAYVYDDNGNQTTRTAPGAADKSWEQSWDYDNRLIKVEKIKGSDRRTVTYSYDPLGRRIGKQLTTILKGVTTTSSWSYIYDGRNIALEIYTDESGAATRTYYTHGQGVDEYLAMERNGQSYYFHQDGLGSVTAITDQNKSIIQSYTYDSFGMPKPETNFRNSYSYTGREWDKESGLYYYRARYYDPMEGRFISEDPIRFAGGINFYAYVQNNPVNHRDPSGLDSPGCDSVGFNSYCTLKCCAKHDECYDQNQCTASSWFKTFSNNCSDKDNKCNACNIDAAACIGSCVITGQGLFGNTASSDKASYYCAKQHQYINVPGDFPDLQSAIVACKSD